MGGSVQWLTDEEQSAWRALLHMQAVVNASLNRQLAEEAGLSLQDYGVLAALTDQPDGRMRPVELARLLAWEKSRLSHHLARMMKRGLVARDVCPSDRRGWLAAVTDEGRRVIDAAAPGHVAAVRRVFVDRLTPEQLELLTAISDRIVTGLAGECDAALAD